MIISQTLRNRPSRERREEKPKVVKKEIPEETSHTSMEHLSYIPNFIKATTLCLPITYNVQQLIFTSVVPEAYHQISTLLAHSAIERHNTTAFQGPFMQMPMTRGPFTFLGSFDKSCDIWKNYTFHP